MIKRLFEYVCPHCGHRQNNPDRCPTYKRALVVNLKSIANGSIKCHQLQLECIGKDKDNLTNKRKLLIEIAKIKLLADHFFKTFYNWNGFGTHYSWTIEYLNNRKSTEDKAVDEFEKHEWLLNEHKKNPSIFSSLYTPDKPMEQSICKMQERRAELLGAIGAAEKIREDSGDMVDGNFEQAKKCIERIKTLMLHIDNKTIPLRTVKYGTIVYDSPIDALIVIPIDEFIAYAPFWDIVNDVFVDLWKVDYNKKLKAILNNEETMAVSQASTNEDTIPVGIWNDLQTSFYVHNDITDEEFVLWVKSFDASEHFRPVKENAKKIGKMAKSTAAENSQAKYTWSSYGKNQVWVDERYRKADYLRSKITSERIETSKTEKRLSRALNHHLHNAKGFLEQYISKLKTE